MPVQKLALGEWCLSRRVSLCRAVTRGAAMATQRATKTRRTDIYNDPTFNYAQFWSGRDYEHDAEVIAIRRLLRGRRFGHAVDIGGGYGRLSVVLAAYADRVTLVDPSTQQLDLSRHMFPDHQCIERQLMDAANLRFSTGTVDLVALIRVLHHLPDPEAELTEMARILKPGGLALVEVANSANAHRRVARLLHRQGRVPAAPVDLRSEESRNRGTAPYFNHHPRTVIGQFNAVGLDVLNVLSVSNLRHPLIKAIGPRRAMLVVEQAVQQPLGSFYFGPSAFFLLQKRPSRHRVQDVPIQDGFATELKELREPNQPDETEDCIGA
jgi:SAM-dependent methyltransferase